MNFGNQKVLVVGIGKSGIAAAAALLKRGARVTVCDRRSIDINESGFKSLAADGAVLYGGGYPQGDWDLVVVSPGVPLTVEPVTWALANGRPVWGELELAYRLKAPEVMIAAVTGTNGKTTTTALLGEIFAAQGLPSATAGNIGVPLASVVEEMSAGWIACEVSSFQLETTYEFRPRVAGIINITPDHLDRHHTITEYIQAKARIFSRMQPEDVLVLNYDDEEVRNLAEKAACQVVFCSRKDRVPGGVYFKKGVIYSEYQNIGDIIRFDATRLRGQHNLENLLVATAMALAVGIEVDVLRSALSSFAGVRHRLEEVAVKTGVLYINDSKGTNPDSTIKAIQSFDQPIILIAGGRHKGGDLTALAELIKERVRALVLLGEARNIIKEKMHSCGYNAIIETETLEEAVKAASQASRAGDVVLLSPACASWDMFENYEQRGDLFCSLVRKIPD
ncbi:MAG: UDP-N-acetylmuramoyl-L-alanine--D-glutamate ligase [Methylocystaceae bacterium]